MPRFGLSRLEMLKSRKAIDAVFAGRKRVAQPPLLVWYQAAAGEGRVQVGVSCSKRLFKRAVDRNRVKRLIREAYRLQKEPLVSAALSGHMSLRVFFNFTGRELPDQETIFLSMGGCIRQLIKKMAHESLS